MLDVYSLFVALKGLNDNQTGIAVAEVEEKNTAARDLKKAFKNHKLPEAAKCKQTIAT
jgi:hypothetical protein